MGNLIMSPEYEAQILQNLPEDKREEFIRVKKDSDFGKAKQELESKLQELKNLSNKMNK